MSRLYKQRGIWYIDITHRDTRIRKSLNTKHRSTAKKLSREIEPEIIRDILIGHRSFLEKDMPEQKLSIHFLNAKHDWKETTKRIYAERLSYYYQHGFPHNHSTKAMTIRCLNAMYKWAYENKYTSKPKKLSGGGNWKARMRTFNKDELSLILNKIKPYHFQLFVRFAYYTGARRGEVASLNKQNIIHEFVVGKSGKRQIKINSQAREVLNEVEMLWNYKLRYISQTFKKNLRRLDIKDGRFHDLRRTFGLNLIKKGMPIYEVSKLLGHSSVSTTEKHYAPLLVSQIKDFRL